MVVLVALIVILPLARFAAFTALPAGKGRVETIVELGKGRPLRSLAEELQSRRIISSARLFVLYARLKGGDARLKAGYYQFSDGMRPSQILTKMVTGDFYRRMFAVPEGYSTYQIAEMLEKRGIFTKDAFLAACRDKKLLSEFKIHADSAEGYLFPGAYNIIPGRTEKDVLKEMVERQQSLIAERFAARLKQSHLSEREVLTLASMIEKEAMVATEKPLIAGVFQNRLRKGMRLQSDPTALYGVRAFAGKVSKRDILKDTPYNTYRIAGLPPGPIGNPGADSIDAVLTHPPTTYFYFVARGDGSHQFSSTLGEHNLAVRTYLRSTPPPAAGPETTPVHSTKTAR
ncbi:endolytic transglycosylase MltG [Geomesophilobacter sediminis]|uniref:endolytic transglycosylase MltG n=1 Tax=Geomesophilobacter sediminis TaxID=2798584 RepID=UPI002E2A1D61|nr:endolytic transglycosylase MltG [Geomesophilobacter sediminis]